jgi:glycosyltransferase involved in cell wall biosynthesis
MIGIKQMPLFDIRRLSHIVYESIKGTAEVVVVVPLYNNAPFITECLKSVVEQNLTALSLCVIDDCSTDGGPNVALKLIQQHADRFATVRLLRHLHNHGPSMARNTGVAYTNEPYIFMLDSDNRIRRPAISRLREALYNSRANFAYSQVWLFGAESGPGTADIWSVERLRSKPYIDMMALIERDALIEAGGIKPLADDLSWEDHDLWCRFAELGKFGVFLPELLCDYRVHASQRSKLVPEAVERLSSEIALRHPKLFRDFADAAYFDTEHILEAVGRGKRTGREFSDA